MIGIHIELFILQTKRNDYMLFINISSELQTIRNTFSMSKPKKIEFDTSKNVQDKISLQRNNLDFL